LRASSFALPLPFPLEEGRRVVVGIRPEHLGRGATIPATVDIVEPIGHETIVYASAGAEKLVAIFDPHDAPRAGETISLDVSSGKVHLFDAATEAALS
jgi:multiple sugar transport system ATP-binding protein